MKLRKTLLTFLLIMVCVVNVTAQKTKNFSDLKGPYFGQQLPGAEPVKFAPGFISTNDYFEISSTFSPDSKEFYFTRRGGEYGEINTLLVSRLVDGRWTQPSIVSFSGTTFDYEPFITPDGKKLLFGSNRPAPAKAEPGRGGSIWFVERQGDTWSEPQYHCHGMFASATSDGTIYVTRGRDGICRQSLTDGKYSDFVSLTDPINLPRADFHPFIAPDESYLIFDSYDRPENIGGADLYISFRNVDGSWSNPVNLGKEINTEDWEGCPNVSPDGNYFFFTREGDIYWVNAEVFEKFRPKSQ